jgi:hypothetical protein
MHHSRKLVVGIAVLLVVAGGGAAIAATRALTPQQESQAVLNDAAGQLGVQPEELSDALKQAYANRVDAAVAAGRLTKEQGEELKRRIQSDDFPVLGLGPRGFSPRGFGPHRRHGGFGHFGKFEAAASYLGMTKSNLRAALVGGKTLAQVARDRGKSVDGLIQALLDDAERRLDEAVKAGRITEAEKRSMLAGLKPRITHVVNGRVGPPGGHRFRDGRRMVFPGII